MPALPLWYDRLEEIVGELRAMEVAYLDRDAVEKLFGVGERRARQLMTGLSGVRVGNAMAVERVEMLARCEGLLRGDEVRLEKMRRVRVAESVEAAQRVWAGRRVQLERGRTTRVVGLPEGVEMGGGEMRIRYSDAMELAEKLWKISQAMAGDWEGFAAAAGD
jgi:hypothetical protein